jgi:hypothetical protein
MARADRLANAVEQFWGRGHAELLAKTVPVRILSKSAE